MLSRIPTTSALGSRPRWRSCMS